MDNINKMIEEELKFLKGCYENEKTVLKIRMEEGGDDAGLKIKILRKLSLYNTRIAIIVEAIYKLQNKIEHKYVPELNSWQLN